MSNLVAATLILAAPSRAQTQALRLIPQLGHTGPIAPMCFSPDSRRLLTASLDRTVSWWDVETGAWLYRFSGAAGAVESVDCSGGTQLLAADDRVLSLWDASVGTEVRTFTLDQGIADVDLSPDGHHVLAIDRASHAHVWSADTGALIWEKDLGAVPSEVRWSADGSTLLTAGPGSHVYTWAASTGRMLAHFQQEVGTEILTAACNRDCSLVLTAGGSDGAFLWDARRGVLLRDFAEFQRVSRLSFLASGKQASALVDAHEVQFWDLSTGEVAWTSEMGQGWSMYAVAPDGSRVAMLDQVGELVVSDTATDRVIYRVQTQNQPNASYGVTFAPDSRTVAVGSQDGYAAVLDGDGRGKYLEGHALLEDWAVFSDDGMSILTSSGSSWDLVSGVRRTAPSGPHGRAPVGGPVAERRDNGDVVLLGLQGGPPVVLRAGTGLYTAPAVSPDGRHVAAASGTSVTLWDVAAAQPLGPPLTHERPVSSSVFAPAGDRLLVVHRDGATTLWNTRTRTVLGRSPAVGTPTQAAFSRDGLRLLVTNADGVRLLDASTGQVLATLVSFSDKSWAVVDPQGRFDTPDIGALADSGFATPNAVWVRPFDPWRPLPLTTFARGTFTPGLLSLVARGQSLPDIPNLLELNVLTPTVTLSAEPVGDEVRVTATVCTREGAVPMSDGVRQLSSGARDLQVYAAGRLAFTLDESLPNGCSDHRVTLSPPAGARYARFSAHAFNSDGAKSSTAYVQLANPRASMTPRRRAFVVTVGVNDPGDPRFSALQFADADALALADALSRVPADEVHVVTLAAGGDAAATRANLRGVFEALGGGPALPWAPGFTRSGPDDLVLTAFSGHGSDGASGEFELALDEALPASELAAWLRRVRAGEMALIVDACRSAGAVDRGDFQPAPLGDRTFGQLAYDKGMIVLAATQSDADALESVRLGHGVLTWALLHDGLESGLADTSHDGEIRLREWFEYAAERTPELAQRVRDGSPIPGARTLDPFRPNPRVLRQVPRVFSFKGSGETLIRSTAP